MAFRFRARASSELQHTLDPESERFLRPSIAAALATLTGSRVLDVGGRLPIADPVVRHRHPTRLPWPRAHFDAAVAVDVIAMLDAPARDEHLGEIARVVRRGGRVVITVPARPATVFTDATSSSDVARKEIERVLAEESDVSLLAAGLLAVRGVTRAVVLLTDRPRLIDVETLQDVDPGTAALLRLPDRVVRHRVHGVADVVAAARSHGLLTESVELRVDPLAGTAASSLGDAYADNPPHAVLHLVRG